MSVMSWLLIGAAAFFAITCLVSVGWYLYVRRQVRSHESGSSDSEINDDSETSDVAGGASNANAEKDRDVWLSLLVEQSEVCQTLIEQYGQNSPHEKAILTCWQTFLDVEITLLSNHHKIQETERLLDAFAPLVERLMDAQDVEMMLRKLSVNTKLLKQINKIVQKTGDQVFEQMNVTSNLNLQLEKAQAKLLNETELDQELAELRAEIASMYDLAERLKRESALETAAHSDEYHLALDDFLDGALGNDFLAPMADEMDHKINDLKHLADYQADAIADLKKQLKEVKERKDKGKHIDTADIAVARMEKAMLENNKVIKSLENKLLSVQTIKHNLNVDVRRREAELLHKDAMLKEKQRARSGGDEWRDVIEQEYSAMSNMEKLLSDIPLTDESQEFHTEQGGKVGELRAMVRESELYVEMLESDLDKLKEKKESLEETLAAALRGEKVDIQSANNEAKAREEVENLREINSELSREQQKLVRELDALGKDDEETAKLKDMIIDLDQKIETVQAQYVAMEEKYLNAMMSQE
ncbi:hypothetical protein GV054_03640 [Marinomonas mediterranea]|uniref:hypothetical protein n=1 Tax=Marinomonas mediterranea TaxID=119864 RepID=UPI0023492753|nr:hypothetical protein [Marinomonas mediterranea]WCN12166.1 hypothetical protein GV054_03640 [Marinomonas mediterranea]